VKLKDAPLKRSAAVIIAALTFHTGAVKAGDETTFPTANAIRDWAQSTSWGGNSVQELSYEQKRLMVVIRSHTSGVESAEPFVFLAIGDKWVKVLHGATCRCGLDTSIQGSVLVFQRKASANNKETPQEYLRLNLKEL
jgi:hypothetical protein